MPLATPTSISERFLELLLAALILVGALALFSP